MVVFDPSTLEVDEIISREVAFNRTIILRALRIQEREEDVTEPKIGLVQYESK